MLLIPEFISREAWDGYCDMREVMWKSKKVPWTERAQKIAIRQLSEWHAQGFDANYILDEAVLKGWRGLFVNERTPHVLRDKNGAAYRVTVEGFREYLQ